MKTKITLLFIALSLFGFSQTGTKLSLSQIQYASGAGYIPYTDATGKQTYSLLTTVSPTTGLLPNTTSLTINGTTKSFTSTPTFSVGNLNGSLTSGYLPYAVSSTSVVNSPLFTNGMGVSTDGTFPYFAGIANSFETGNLGVTGEIAVGNTGLAIGGGFYRIRNNGGYLNYTSTGGHEFTNLTGNETTYPLMMLYTDYNTTKDLFTVTKQSTLLFKIKPTGGVHLPLLNANSLLYADASNDVSSVVLGSGLSLSSGTLTATGTSSTTTLTGVNNVTVTGSAPNYTVGVQSSPTFTTVTLTGVTTQSTTNFTGQVKQFKGADAASSSTVDLGSLTGNYVHITGTVTINSFGTAQAGTEITTVFDNTLTITTSTNIVMPDNYNIVTAAGDIAIWRSEGGGVWNLVNYQIKSNSWFPWTTTFTGFSSNPAGYTFRYTLVGKMCTCYYVGAAGTSNATSFTMTLPFVAANTVAQSFSVLITDAGTSTAGFIRTRVNSNVMDVYKGPSFNAFTNSGNKSVTFSSFTYEIQ